MQGSNLGRRWDEGCWSVGIWKGGKERKERFNGTEAKVTKCGLIEVTA